ncbi:MAG TPA: pantoate--beta-alanine ligase, partial [Bacteroidales bacterium]|nr:pantoate--beta-alanine ligase [Bacteroidales bacterium]
PTMGALHEGHLSLVHKAVNECAIVIVSIFVNPTQFNDKKDLKNYPRTVSADLELLEAALRDNDIVFIPETAEMYPEEDTRQFSFGNLDRVMEASHRPGHFNGVAQIVSKLFSIVDPDLAYFGLKDFQQVAVIRDLVRQLKFKVKIITCPIIRERDGLAMSSRNRLLEPAIRKDAPVIYQSLMTASEMIKEKDVPEIRRFVSEEINKKPGFEVEYFEVADDVELFTVESKKEMVPGRTYFGCIAVKAGNIRLIDNIRLG